MLFWHVVLPQLGPNSSLYVGESASKPFSSQAKLSSFLPQGVIKPRPGMGFLEDPCPQKSSHWKKGAGWTLWGGVSCWLDLVGTRNLAKKKSESS